MKNNITKKMGITAIILALLDMFALGVIGYMTLYTSNIFLMLFLIILGVIFAVDAIEAFAFVHNVLKK